MSPKFTDKEEEMKKNSFSKKIEYLFNNLNITEEEFVKLFWNGKKPNLSVRKKTVIGKWYEGDISQAKAFYFDTYPISKLHSNGQTFFTKNAFLEDSFENFKKRVDIYIAHTTRPKNLFEYKYIYYYDINLKVVTYVKLYTEEELNNNKYKIRLISSDLYKNRDINTYYGELHIINDYYHISVKNNFEIITFYFILNKGLSNNSAIYGLRLGLSYDKGLPISGKNLLSKKILSPEEEEKFYLNANESDTLISDESIQDIYSLEQENYLKKLHNKIDNLSLFMKKTKETLIHTIESDIYINLFYNGLSSLNHISKKVYNNRTFYSYRRRSTRKIFLQQLSLRSGTTCTFVYPLFTKDSSLFDEEGKNSKESLNHILEVINNGLEIQMILVVRQENEINQYTKEWIKKFIHSGAKVKIAIKENISHLVNSYDFLYESSKNIAIYRNTGDRVYYFKVTTNHDLINNLSYDFDIIQKYSFEFQDYLNQSHQNISKELNDLIGTWYAYSYGTMEIEGKTKIWEIRYEIDKQKKITAFYADKLTYNGHLYLENPKRSYIVLTSLISLNQSFITFYNKDIHKKIFKISMIYNQFSMERDMMTFGILSKTQLELDIVRKTLGEQHESSLKESAKLEERIKNLYIKYEF